MTEKLIYEEPIRFSGANGGQQKTDQQFDMTCSCGKKFPVPLDILGTSVPCPQCGNYVKISDEEFMPITCGCGKSLRIPSQTAGAGKKCPSCKKPIKLLIMPSVEIQPETPCEIPAAVNGGKIEQSAERTDSKPDQTAQKPQNTSVKVRCSCGKKFAVPAAIAHKPIECPQCHNNFKLSRKYFIRINCPCGTEFKILDIFEGRTCKCPKCGRQQKAVKTLNLKSAG